MNYDSKASSLTGTTDPAIIQELPSIRSSIDNIDATLVYLLAERFKCTQEVGRLKAEHDLPPSDPEREKAQIKRLHSLSEDAELDPEFAEKFLTFISEEVIRHHKAISQEQQCRTRLRWLTAHWLALICTPSISFNWKNSAHPIFWPWRSCHTWDRMQPD